VTPNQTLAGGELTAMTLRLWPRIRLCERLHKGQVMPIIEPWRQFQ
jgi:hypothetical protein